MLTRLSWPTRVIQVPLFILGALIGLCVAVMLLTMCAALMLGQGLVEVWHFAVVRWRVSRLRGRTI
jgi:hypothetical protein